MEGEREGGSERFGPRREKTELLGFSFMEVTGGGRKYM